MATRYVEEQVNELLLQALETERGGIQVYTHAIKAAQNDDLRKEWKEYLDQTRHHEQVLLGIFADLGLDPEAQSPGRDVVRHLGEGLVQAILMAIDTAPPAAAELVAGGLLLAAGAEHAAPEAAMRSANEVIRRRGIWFLPESQSGPTLAPCLCRSAMLFSRASGSVIRDR